MALSPLEDVSIGRRVGLSVAVVFIAVLGLATLDYFEDGAAAQQQAELALYEDIPLDATLLHLDKTALNDAYHDYVVLIMSVYLKGNLADDERAKAGFKKARAAYNIVASQIAKREQEL